MPFAVNDGIRLFYETEGEGLPVLFHTGAGGDSRMWRDAGYLDGLPEFSKILMDQRGRGRSDHPDGIEAHRMECYVADIVAVLDHAGISACGFWGYSLGILIGIAFGSAHRERLRCLVGTGGLYYGNLSELPPVEPAQIIAEDVAQGGVRAEVDRLMKSEQDRFPSSIDRNVREGDPRMHALARAARRTWRGPRALFLEFRQPTLLLTGEYEDVQGDTERSARELPNAHVVRIRGVGHLGAFYRSDLVLPVAVPFLRRAHGIAD